MTHTAAQLAFLQAALGAHLAAFVVRLLGRRRLAWACFAIAFALTVVGVALRAAATGHWPLQNLFEVFVLLAALVFPLSVLCRRLLGVGGEAADMVLAAALLAGPAFFLPPEPRPLPPALQSPLFVPHVAAYVLAYVILAKAGVVAAGLLLRGDAPPSPGLVSRGRAVDRLIALGFPLLTAGLLLGSVWGKLAWGDWWNWDPKEMWSLATWLVYVGCLHVRATWGRRASRATAALAVLGVILIAATLLWANISRLFAGLHSYE